MFIACQSSTIFISGSGQDAEFFSERTAECFMALITGVQRHLQNSVIRPGQKICSLGQAPSEEILPATETAYRRKVVIQRTQGHEYRVGYPPGGHFLIQVIFDEIHSLLYLFVDCHPETRLWQKAKGYLEESCKPEKLQNKPY